MAHAALLLAFAVAARDPRGAAGFFYHPRMLGLVHLVTLGWITGSILGALYLVGPIAMRVNFPARWPDYVAFALLLIGIVGIVAHFWIEEYAGMAWSAGTAGTGIVLAGARVVPSLRGSPAHPAVRAHIVLAFANIAGAAVMGVLLGIEKVHHFLPGYVLDNVYAHAHLAAIGWATMMVVGVGYRLLPMVLPSQPPEGRRLWTSAALLEAGIVGLFISLLLRAVTIPIFAFAVVGGLLAFVTEVGWMLAHPRPRPPAIRMPDPAVLHGAAAFLSLGAACGLGLWLATTRVSAATPGIAIVYGVLGLLGFLAQLIVAMKTRLLPLFAWYWAFANTNYKGPVESPHAMAWRPARYAVVALWWIGVPLLAWGLASTAIGLIRASALALLAATVVDTIQSGAIVRRAYRGSRSETRMA